MAKKQTLKSLLGGGDGRVQASLNLGTPKLQPTIGRGGQSVTATQGTLRADQTQLGMLASSLEKLNPALQAYRKGYYAEAEKDLDRTTADGKASAVHFLHFTFDDYQIEKFKNKNNNIHIGIEHESYGHLAIISDEIRDSLMQEFN